MSPATPTAAGANAHRDKLLETAAALFYAEGIKGIGVDRILSEAGTTRATMYRHFPGKEALVAAYLEREDAIIRGYFEAAAAAGGTPRQLVEFSRWAILLAFIIGAIATPGPEISSQVLVSVSLIALYFLSIGIAFVLRPRAKA